MLSRFCTRLKVRCFERGPRKGSQRPDLLSLYGPGPEGIVEIRDQAGA